ncbi:erbin-like isoform X2 [Xenopus laevis]|uniref:Erbin-like isoform X2 n=1 Tax=Xenopus laevis TaxID=8355 RepID=A0A8J0UAW5_XENLA|nr:erbin-like isoform X2 [Xenopus laevis]
MTSKRSLLMRLVPCRCLRGEEETVTSLDYSHCSLEQVPKEIFTFEKTLEELYLDANQIEELPKQLFNCQSLHKLSLPDNDLSILPASIANLINLRELDVSKNGIQEFPENIKNCKILTIVEASVNPISKLPDGFSQLLNLTQLYLNDAFLDFLPANFGRLTKLQILELRENQLKMLPKTMNRLTQLERLDLGSNEFTEVLLGSLKQLTYLDVSKNNIEMVEDGISGCESLQDLLLSSNAIQQLPESIGALKKLTTLKMDENQLMYLPDSVGGLTAIEDLDCSFNEIEALPSSIGHLTQIRTFAADHNFLTQLPAEIGNWKSATVLFLHSNKLECLPEEMGDMQKLKVINLSDNRLKNLPFSFTRLQQLTAMWLSDNQSKPLIPLQKETDQDTQKVVLTNYMFPQQPRTEDVIFSSDNESFNLSLWEEQRKQRAQVAFECDEVRDDREVPAREGNLKRYPTPYPDELKNMVKTVQTIVHRKKDEEKAEEANKDSKQKDGDLITLQDDSVKTSEAILVEIDTEDKEKNIPVNRIKKPNEPSTEHSIGNSQSTALLNNFWNASTVNHEETLEGSEDFSYDGEMKMAEMRPPLIETSMNHPKVVALSNNKKDDIKDADSLSDEVTRNSNQNNSNCSSPSRMSDSVSLNTDSSHDTSLCSPEKDSNIGANLKIRQEDENFNNLMQNGDKMIPADKMEIAERPDISSDADSVLRERRVNNSMEKLLNLNQLNKNNNNLACEHSDSVENAVISQDGVSDKCFANYSEKEETDNRENGNKFSEVCVMNRVNGHLPEELVFPDSSDPVRRTSEDSVPSVDMCISKSTDDLSIGDSLGSVVKSRSITNIETGPLRVYGVLSDSNEQQFATRMSSAIAEGQNIVRSKSATVLCDQPLQVFTGSSSSSDLASSSMKKMFKFDSNHNPEGPYAVAGPQASHISAVPQYNVQYSSSAAAKDNLWAHKQSAPEHGSLPSSRFHPPDSLDSPNYVNHSANLNFSNHNNVRASNMYNVHQRMGPRHVEAWASTPNERILQVATRSTLQRQGSGSSNASASLGEAGPARRVIVPEGDYMNYREIHSMSRGNHMVPGPQRPTSARTYSIDGPNVPRPQSARPSVTDIPERTMSVCDFNYSRTSPTKKPNARVNSEHSLLDPQGRNKVPHDWRDQVMRHIEAKKLEKSMLSRSFNCTFSATGSSLYGSCRDLHGSQGSVALSVAPDRRGSAGHILRYPQPFSVGESMQDDVFVTGQQSYPTIARKESTADSVKKMHLSNGQMCQPSRPQANYSQFHQQPAQPTVGRHPSREQLLDYYALKVAQQPPYSQTPCPSKQINELSSQEIRVRLVKDPELGFSISGGVGGRGNPFRPGDDGIFVTRVQPEGPASKLLQPGDKILQANGFSFINIDHALAVTLLKKFQNAVELIVSREGSV